MSENKAFDLVQRIQELLNWQSQSFLEIGKLLAELREGKLYRDYASHIRWMGDIAKELHISKSQLHNYERVWTVFGKRIQKLNLQIPLLRLIKLVPLVRKGEDIDEWLHKAATLPYEDFLDEIQIWKGNPSYIECEHEEVEEYERCRRCGKWITKKDFREIEEKRGREEMLRIMGEDRKEKIPHVC